MYCFMVTPCKQPILTGLAQAVSSEQLRKRQVLYVKGDPCLPSPYASYHEITYF